MFWKVNGQGGTVEWEMDRATFATTSRDGPFRSLWCKTAFSAKPLRFQWFERELCVFYADTDFKNPKSVFERLIFRMCPKNDARNFAHLLLYLLRSGTPGNTPKIWLSRPRSCVPHFWTRAQEHYRMQKTRKSPIPNTTAHTHTHIYIYAVELKTGPRFGVSSVKNWSKSSVKNWSNFFWAVFPSFIVFFGHF